MTHGLPPDDRPDRPNRPNRPDRSSGRSDQPDDLGRILFKDVRLPTEPEAARFARREVALVVAEWALPAEVCDAGELCVSELVTNAWMHARGRAGATVRVMLLRRSDRLRIEVHDTNPDLPREQSPSLTAESGRGLFIVAQFARDHGTYPTPSGKAVWAEIAAWPKDEANGAPAK